MSFRSWNRRGAVVVLAGLATGFGPAGSPQPQMQNSTVVQLSATAAERATQEPREARTPDTSGGNEEQMAMASARLGDLSTAIAYQRLANASIEKRLELNLSVGSERQKQEFVRSIADDTDRTISLHLDWAPDRSDAADLAATVLLQRKGRVLDAMRDTFAMVRQRASDPRDQEMLSELNATTAQLAALARRADSGDREARHQAIRELETRVECLQADLAEHSAEFRAPLGSITLESVQAVIPADAALVEFGQFHPFDPDAEGTSEAYGPPHYVAYIVRNSGTPSGVDLGLADTIDRQVASLREQLRDPHRREYSREGRDLYERVMRPLSPFYGNVRRLLVSPDGDLNLLPFEALVDDRGRYLLERYAITYLSSGRDLLRVRVRRPPGGAPVVMANPAFGEPDAPAGSTFYFTPLPASGAEALAIKRLFPDATLLTGSRATKAALLQVRAPSIVHVASHGFFLPDRRDSAGGSDALLRSGLAFAGANMTDRVHDDGILTALEASGLNLWGTKLVTLSACNTGVGEVRNGDGVYGLRRALVLAGAESLVMSLWPVSDTVARETMTTYYRGLRAGLGRGDALRRAKLELMRRPGRQHPFFWASFIQSGEWANLDGKR